MKASDDELSHVGELKEDTGTLDAPYHSLDQLALVEGRSLHPEDVTSFRFRLGRNLRLDWDCEDEAIVGDGDDVDIDFIANLEFLVRMRHLIIVQALHHK